MADGQQTSETKPKKGSRALAPLPADRSSHVAFRQFMEARQARPGAKPVNTAPLFKPVKPTPERLGKLDHPRRTEGGYYSAPPPIQRMRNQGLLDPRPRTNEAMYTAATTLADCYYKSGLAERVKGQDLTGTGGGGSNAASYMPVSEFAAHHRLKYQEAIRKMGWYEAFPFRGCGRLVVDVICREHSLRDASAIHFPNTRTETAQAAGMERLKEGLFLLAMHWRLV